MMKYEVHVAHKRIEDACWGQWFFDIWKRVYSKFLGSVGLFVYMAGPMDLIMLIGGRVELCTLVGPCAAPWPHGMTGFVPLWAIPKIPLLIVLHLVISYTACFVGCLRYARAQGYRWYRSSLGCRWCRWLVGVRYHFSGRWQPVSWGYTWFLSNQGFR